MAPPRTSPPKHRHDGTSPLPLGMDWSPPPKKWDGRNTIWPHNAHTGWSYCVMIPSWTIQAGSGTSSDSFLNPVVVRLAISLLTILYVRRASASFTMYSSILGL